MKYRKKPVEVEAEQLTDEAFGQCLEFLGQEHWNEADRETCKIRITTLEGEMYASKNDWIIKGVNGEFYPVKDDIFHKTYEPVD